MQIKMNNRHTAALAMAVRLPEEPVYIKAKLLPVLSIKKTN